MSFSGRPADLFLGPLCGRTTAFLVDARETNLAFARSLLYNLARTRRPCIVLDIDAFYSSNADFILAPLAEENAAFADFFIPDPDSDIESEVVHLLQAAPAKTLIVDSLNSLYHLLSDRSRGLRTRSLAFLMDFLSYTVRSENRAAFFTTYQRERPSRFAKRASITDLADVTVSATLTERTLLLKCERGHAWPGRSFRLPIP